MTAWRTQRRYRHRGHRGHRGRIDKGNALQKFFTERKHGYNSFAQKKHAPNFSLSSSL